MISASSPTTVSDSPIDETVRAAQRGDRKAFGCLVERYQRAVYATVYRRLRNHAEAQELCQDVFLQAMRKIGQLQDARCFGSWLRSIAGRMAINRSVRRRPAVALHAMVLENACVETKTPLMALLGPRAERASPPRAAAAPRAGPANANGLLRRRQQSQRDEPAVCLTRWHDQAAAARRPQAFGPGVGGAGAARAPRNAQKAAVASLGGKAGDGTGRAVALFFVGWVLFRRQPIGYGCGGTPIFSSSSSWMMIRGVTIIIRLWVCRPMPTFWNSRLM